MYLRGVCATSRNYDEFATLLRRKSTSLRTVGSTTRSHGDYAPDPASTFSSIA